MSETQRFRVLQSFPVWRRVKDAQLGEIFEVELSDVWHAVGGGFYLKDSPRGTVPDFSGARLHWLLRNKYIEWLPHLAE